MNVSLDRFCKVHTETAPVWNGDGDFVCPQCTIKEVFAVNEDQTGDLDKHDFVGKYFQMDPETDNLLFDGSYLRDGMIVLAGDSSMRAEIRSREMPGEILEQALTHNRWCEVEHVVFSNSDVSFIAIYEDGTKKKRAHLRGLSWYVKIDSIADNEDPPDEEVFAPRYKRLFGKSDDGSVSINKHYPTEEETEPRYKYAKLHQIVKNAMSQQARWDDDLNGGPPLMQTVEDEAVNEIAKLYS